MTVDEHNADLVTDEMRAAVGDTERKIIAGEIEMHDYTTDDSRPV